MEPCHGSVAEANISTTGSVNLFAGLGNARTAALANGGKIGVRGPMHEIEEPVVRPYLLVDDIEAAAELPSQGTFAIYIQGGIHHGLWQV